MFADSDREYTHTHIYMWNSATARKLVSFLRTGWFLVMWVMGVWGLLLSGQVQRGLPCEGHGKLHGCGYHMTMVSTCCVTHLSTFLLVSLIKFPLHHAWIVAPEVIATTKRASLPVTSCHFPMAQLAPHLVASVAGPVAGPMAAMAQMGPGRPARASRAPQAQWDGRVAALGLSLCPWVPKARATRGRRSARQRLTEQVKQVQRYKRGELSEFDTGVSTGYQSLDQNFRPVRGEVITLCGRPGSGKSEFILSVALNLAQKHGWKTGLCLFEHKADQLTLQLLEKRTQKNFRDLGSLSTEDEAWISEHFRPVADFSAEMDLEQILRRAGRYAEDGNLQNLIIDPYNYIAAPQGLGSEFSETELVSGYMTQLQRFAKKYQVCVWVVVHPTKGSQIAGAQPNLYDMQGSAHWYNKCDKGLYVVRPNRDPDVGSTCEVEIHVLKVRNGDSGRVGITKLEFQPEIRSYKELVPEMAWRHWEATLDLASPREICWKVPKGGKTGTWTRGRLRCQHLGLVGLACWGWSKLSLLEK